MGILYKAAVAEKRLKHNFILERLQKMGITVSQQGIPLDQLTYEELKYEYVLASFREVDADNSEEKWF
ncbi:hypothetical protein AF332_20725 [Sporosarcina globispora]|uniref:Fur-regulated basic protein FbpA n=1 Tax=Sporosarcina globispora TaxID=1459 RepID=A0A0M0GHN1_SPOGL|nr:hypothetical protein [Sporosarcina globispora]KON88972.1 hypothetical protein AF332_20725 [Sporosarcina globispora]